MRTSIRYYLIKFLDRLQRKDVKRCIYCGKKLSETEIEYYENTCNTCENKLMMRLWKE